MRSYTSRGAAEIDLDGETFRFAASAFELVEIQERFGDIDIESTAAAAAFGEIFKRLLGAVLKPDGTWANTAEYDKFRAHCSRHNTDAATLQNILNDAVEDMAGRPLGSPPESPSGPQGIGPKLRAVSPARGDVAVRAAAIQRLGGEVSLTG